jgi:hypothetical protein
MLITEEEKQSKKNFSCFFANFVAPLTVTYNISVEEKKENHMVDIK